MKPKHPYVLLLTALVLGTFAQYEIDNDSRVDKNIFLLRSGQNPIGDGTQETGLYNSSAMIPNTVFHRLAYSTARVENVLPSASITQGYRKHFDLRRTYGINRAH